MKFNLNKFKKIASDKHSTTLEHPEGHRIVIAHEKLSPKLRGQLAELPHFDDGGEVKKDKGKYIDPEAAKQIQKGATQAGPSISEAWSNLKAGLGFGDDEEKKAHGGEVEKMADGGQVDDKNSNAAAEISKGASESKPEDMSYIKNLKEGLGLADGGIAQDTPEKIAQDAAAQAPAPQPVVVNVNSGPAQPQPGVLQSMGQSLGNVVGGRAQMLGNAVKGIAGGAQEFGKGFNSAMPQDQEEPAPASPPPSGLPSGIAPAQPPQQPAIPENKDPYGLDAYSKTYMGGLNQELGGLQKEAEATGQMGAEKAAVYQDAALNKQALLDQANQNFAMLNGEHDALMDDYRNGHVDPNHYLKNSSGTGTAIGLILGGIAGGLLHRENPAMDFLNKQIDRDIQAQQAELGKKHNLLSANMQQYGNVRDATQMTEAMQKSIVADQIDQAGNKAMDPLAKARAQEAAGKLRRESAGTIAQTAMRRTLMSSGALNGGQPDNGKMAQTIQMMRMVDPEQAKSLEARYVPGVGLASIPVPQGARDAIIAKQQLQNMSSNFYQWAEQHSGSLDPATVNEGKTRAAELQSLYRNAINGGVFKKGEQEFIDNIVDSDPTKFFNSLRVLPKLKQVINSNAAQLNLLKRGHGLPTTQFTPGPPVLNNK